MKAIKTKNSMKQLIVTFSMLLFLFTAGNLYSQQSGVRQINRTDINIGGASVNTLPASELGIEVLQSIPDKYDRKSLLTYSITKGMYVEIKLYNKDGVKLGTLVSEKQNAGTHQIIDFSELNKGTYYYQLTIGTYTEIKKIILVN
jgi:hypothetical protein